jgi:pyruvate,water dikinase
VLRSELEVYRQRYDNLLGIQADRDRLEDYLKQLLVEMSDPARPLNAERKTENLEELEERYLSSFAQGDREHARKLLELGRASYRIRDDDNIYLDRFKGLVRQAEELARERLIQRGMGSVESLPSEELVEALRNPDYRPRAVEHTVSQPEPSQVDSRQILGQPASQGLASGRARVVREPQDLFSLRKGEILVCDAIDPAMTFVVPLAAAIVERRGGMLIHGAIIAREYGIPCVTGIPEATDRFNNGDRLTVDGFLGIVVMDSDKKNPGD